MDAEAIAEANQVSLQMASFRLRTTGAERQANSVAMMSVGPSICSESLQSRRLYGQRSSTVIDGR